MERDKISLWLDAFLMPKKNNLNYLVIFGQENVKDGIKRVVDAFNEAYLQ